MTFKPIITQRGICDLCESSTMLAVQAPGIGRICLECKPDVGAAVLALHATRGIAMYPIPDGERNATIR